MVVLIICVNRSAETPDSGVPRIRIRMMHTLRWRDFSRVFAMYAMYTYIYTIIIRVASVGGARARALVHATHMHN